MSNGSTNGKLFILDTTYEGKEAWEIAKVKGKSPGPLDDHTAQMREDGRMFVFGGFGEQGELTNCVYSFDTTNHSW